MVYTWHDHGSTAFSVVDPSPLLTFVLPAFFTTMHHLTRIYLTTMHLCFACLFMCNLENCVVYITVLSMCTSVVEHVMYPELPRQLSLLSFNHPYTCILLQAYVILYIYLAKIHIFPTHIHKKSCIHLATCIYMHMYLVYNVHLHVHNSILLLSPFLKGCLFFHYFPFFL